MRQFLTVLHSHPFRLLLDASQFRWVLCRILCRAGGSSFRLLQRLSEVRLRHLKVVRLRDVLGVPEPGTHQ